MSLFKSLNQADPVGSAIETFEDSKKLQKISKPVAKVQDSVKDKVAKLAA